MDDFILNQLICNLKELLSKRDDAELAGIVAGTEELAGMYKEKYVKEGAA